METKKQVITFREALALITPSDSISQNDLTILSTYSSSAEWGLVKQLLSKLIEARYSTKLDHLYSLIPGQQVSITTKISAAKESFKNFLFGLGLQHAISKQRRIEVTFIEECDFHFSQTELTQLFEGFRFGYINKDKTYEMDFHKLSFMISAALLDSNIIQDVKDADIKQKKIQTLHLTRNHLNILKDVILTRMGHCEDERESGNDKFNPDSYILQKILLLTLKETLVGEIRE